MSTLVLSGDLSRKIQQAGKQQFSQDTVINWFIQILFALKYIHRENIIHRGQSKREIHIHLSVAIGNKMPGND